MQTGMDRPRAKRVKLSTEEVLLELEEEGEPITAGSDDEFDDIICEEKERDEWEGNGMLSEDNIPSTSHAWSSPPHPPYGRPSVSPSCSLSGRISASPPNSDSGGISASPSLSLGTAQSISPPHSLSGRPSASHSHSQPNRSSASALSSRSSAYPLSGTIPRLPESFSQSLCSGNSSTPSTSLPSIAQGTISQQGTTISPTSISDPLSLPLSTYLSLPLSNLVQTLNEALSPQLSACTMAPSPTSTSATSSLDVSSRPSAPPATHVTSRSLPQGPRPSHTGPSTASARSWNSTLEPVDVRPFVEEVGPTVEIPQTPANVFQLYFTEELCSYIVQQTNLYAEQVMGSGFATWDKVTEDELRAYFGFQVYIGIVKEPATEDYWRRDELHFGPIADRIPRKRFRDIHRFLHFADNTTLVPRGQPGYDRLGKVRPIMDKVQQKLTDLYKPNRENALDEAMIKFQGHNRLKQYMPAKPIKRGIKVWCRADSQNGYLYWQVRAD